MHRALPGFFIFAVAVGVLGGWFYLLESGLVPKAHAQVQPPSGGGSTAGTNQSAASYTSSAGSGSGAFIMSTGARICINGASCTGYYTNNSGYHYFAGLGFQVASNPVYITGREGAMALQARGNIQAEGVQLNYAGTAAKPSCDSTVRGMLWYVAAAGGVKDDVQVCAKDAANAYAWRTIY